MKNYQDINSKTIDSWVDNGWEWGKPIAAEIYKRATKGDWGVLLTPSKIVAKDWFCNMKGANVLGLASGGGQQMPIFAALGSICTVMDYSEKQLESEKLVSEREGYDINVIKGDMTKIFPFDDESFDLIFHPVSNCYIEDVNHVWKECHRVLKKGGILLSGLDNGFNYIIDDEDCFSDNKEIMIKNKLPFNPLNDEKLFRESIEKGWGIQFSHTIEEQIGGQLRAGLVLEDIFEDTNGCGTLHELNIPTFWATKAVKK